MPDDVLLFTADEILAELRRRERASGDKTRGADAGEPAVEPSERRAAKLAQVRTPDLIAGMKDAQRAIYGVDNRRDAFEMAKSVRALADASVALVEAKDLARTGDGWELRTSSFKEQYRLCSDEPFGSQPLGCFCSGVLVAPNVIATAGHCVETEADLEKMRFVFGFRMVDKDTAKTTFADDDVYTGEKLIGHQLTADGIDWALVRLDRPVKGRKPVKRRTSGKVGEKDKLFVIGHPCGLPQKFADGATVQQNNRQASLSATLDTYGGNSGSPVFNGKTKALEGLLVRGQTDFVWVGSCRVSQVYPSTGSGGEDVTRTSVWSARVPKASNVKSAAAGKRAAVSKRTSAKKARKR